MFLLISLCGSSFFREDILFSPGEAGSKYYRIPAITTAKDGSLVAVIDKRWNNNADLPGKITVEAKRSTDGGHTWSEAVRVSGETIGNGYGDASIVTDRKSGRIFVIFNGDNGFFGSSASNPLRFYYSYSDDNGITWSDKIEFTQFIYSERCVEHCQYYLPERRNVWVGMFLTSGIALQTREGRIAVASVGRLSTGGGYENRAVYSDDLGLTWNISKNAARVGGDESKLFQTNNGQMVMSIRQYGHRKFSYSDDLGYSWENLTDMNDIHDPNCNGDVMRYTSTIDGYNKDRILHTVPYSGGRNNVSILLSYDEGKTWPIKKVICPSDSAYSAITADHNGDIHVFYEKTMPEIGAGYTNVVASFSLDWITDGKDIFEQASNLNWCISDQASNKCPAEAYRSTNQIFDQYVESYYYYPKTMKYTAVSAVRNFYINLSKPGLVHYSFTNLNSRKPTITFTGGSDSYSEFDLNNVKLVSTAGQLLSKDLKLTNSDLTLTGSVSKIDIVDNKMRVAINTGSKLRNVRYSLITPSTDSQVVINCNENDKITITKKDSTISAPIKLVLAKNNEVTILGSWSADEGNKLTISNSNSNSGTVVRTEQDDDGVFNFEGNKPEIEHVEIVDKDGDNEDNNQDGSGSPGSSSIKFPTAAIIIIIVGVVIIALTIVTTIIILKKTKEDSDSTAQIAFAFD